MDNEATIKEYVYNYLKFTGDNATRIAGHLRICLPYGEDYEALEVHLTSITIKRGNNKGERKYSDEYVKRILKEHKAFNEYRKEHLTLNNNEDMITSQDTQEHLDNVNIEQITPKEDNNTESINTQEAHSEITPPEESTEQSGDKENAPSVEKKRGGRKVSTNRDTRFTLYMTADVLRDMNTLAKYDNSSITDLMNGLLISYINDRRDDIEYMEKFERMKAEREAHKKAR